MENNQDVFVTDAYIGEEIHTPSMKFHNFYKWWTVIIGGLSLMPVLFSSIQSQSMSVYSILSAVLSVITGICLMKMMRAGKIMQTILNIVNIVRSSFITLGSLILMVGGTAMVGYVKSAGVSIASGIFIIVGVFLLIFSVASIVWNACILRYYSKRKHLFN